MLDIGTALELPRPRPGSCMLTGIWGKETLHIAGNEKSATLFRLCQGSGILTERQRAAA